MAIHEFTKVSIERVEKMILKWNRTISQQHHLWIAFQSNTLRDLTRANPQFNSAFQNIYPTRLPVCKQSLKNRKLCSWPPPLHLDIKCRLHVPYNRIKGKVRPRGSRGGQWYNESKVQVLRKKCRAQSLWNLHLAGNTRYKPIPFRLYVSLFSLLL